MRRWTLGLGATLMAGILGTGAACERPVRAASDLPVPAVDVPTTQPSGEQTAVLAGGCFWCVEAVFEQLDGVSAVVSGYAGGTADTAKYKLVSDGSTDHAEVVQVTFDPSKISYGQLLRVFFATHDPTTLNRQGPDWGRQYRSAIFFADEQQRQVAEAYIRQLNEAKAFEKPIVTTLEPLTQFHAAEDYHQDFVQANPSHPYVRQWALPKVEKVHKLFGDEVKQGK